MVFDCFLLIRRACGTSFQRNFCLEYDCIIHLLYFIALLYDMLCRILTVFPINKEASLDDIEAQNTRFLFALCIRRRVMSFIRMPLPSVIVMWLGPSCRALKQERALLKNI